MREVGERKVNPTELINFNARKQFREKMVEWWTLRDIREAFQSVGFYPDQTFSPPADITGQRRILIEQHYSSINFPIKTI